MKIKNVIGPEQVEVGLRVSDKAQLLRELSRRAAAAVSIDQGVIHDALLARENLGSTGLGKGFACQMPALTHYHASSRCLCVSRGQLTSPQSTVSRSIPDHPLLTPADAGNQHLATLAALSRPLRDADFVHRLRRAADAEATYTLLANA